MRVFKTALCSAGLEEVARELEEYKNSLKQKNRDFLNKLSDVGIFTAMEAVSSGSHTMPLRVFFYREAEVEGDTYTVYVVGEGYPFASSWIDSDGASHEDMVYPMSMMEFGSAGYALPPTVAYGGRGGQGTFSQRGNEGFTSWYFKKVEGTEEKKKHGTAIRPTRPLYNAAIKMQSEIESIARDVFGGG